MEEAVANPPPLVSPSAPLQVHPTMAALRGHPSRTYEERCLLEPDVPFLRTSEGQLRGSTRLCLARVLLDTGAKPVLLGANFAQALGITPADLDPPPYQLVTATQAIESVQGITKQPLDFYFNPGDQSDAIKVSIKVLVGPANNYDVLVGADQLMLIGGIVDAWQQCFHYHPDYAIDGIRLASIPFTDTPVALASVSLPCYNAAAGLHYTNPSQQVGISAPPCRSPVTPQVAQSTAVLQLQQEAITSTPTPWTEELLSPPRALPVVTGAAPALLPLQAHLDALIDQRRTNRDHPQADELAECMVITDRAKVLQGEMPMAMQNLQIAQHRDQLRYSTIRCGSYKPKQRKFELDDYVYSPPATSGLY